MRGALEGVEDYNLGRYLSLEETRILSLELTRLGHAWHVGAKGCLAGNRSSGTVIAASYSAEP